MSHPLIKKICPYLHQVFQRVHNCDGAGEKKKDFTVGCGGDFSTIQAAVDNVDAGSTLHLCGKAFDETFDVYDKNLNFLGDAKTEITGNSHVRVEYKNSNGTVLFKNIQFTGLKSENGPVYLTVQGIGNKSQLSVNFENCQFTNNKMVNGAAIMASGVTLNIQNTNFKNNKATGDYFLNSGALWASGAFITVRKSSFDGNSSPVKAGAIYLGDTVCDISETSFHNNSATVAGAIAIDGCTITIDKEGGPSMFVNNIGNTGALYIWGNSSLKTFGKGVTFSGNTSEDNKGPQFTLGNGSTGGGTASLDGAIFCDPFLTAAADIEMASSGPLSLKDTQSKDCNGDGVARNLKVLMKGGKADLLYTKNNDKDMFCKDGTCMLTSISGSTPPTGGGTPPVEKFDKTSVGCSFKDYKSVQSAIDSTNDGGTVTVCGGPYYEALSINKSLTLQGSGSAVVISGAKTSGKLLSATGASLTLNKLNFQSGSGMDLAGVNTVSIQDTYFQNFKSGATVLWMGPGSTTITGSTFLNNLSACIFKTSGNLSITNTKFSANVSDSAMLVVGGQVYVSGSMNNNVGKLLSVYNSNIYSSVTLSGMTIGQNNCAQAKSACFYIREADLKMQGCSVTNNKAATGVVALGNTSSNSTLTSSQTTWSGNTPYDVVIESKAGAIVKQEKMVSKQNFTCSFKTQTCQ